MTNDAISDLARLRRIAEEGQQRPLLGGRILILWGCAVMAALILQWLILAHLIPLPMTSIALSWFALMALAGATSRRVRARTYASGAIDLANRIEKAVWQFGGSFLALVTTCILLVALYRDASGGDPSGYLLFTLAPPMAFGVYAIALRTSAEAANATALKPYAGLSLAFAAGTTLLAGTAWQLLVAAVGIGLVSILPGRELIGLEGK